MTELKVLIEGGKASAGAPLGPALGPLGVNVLDVVNLINEKTKAFTGMKVPVTVIIDKKKNVEVEVGLPPSSQLIAKEAKIEKGSPNPKLTTVGNLTVAQLKKIAEMKIDGLMSSKIKSAVKEIAGTCKQMGVTVDGKDAREAIKEINEGKYDSILKD